MAWWVDPLAWRLDAAAKAMRRRGKFGNADALDRFREARHREIKNFAHHFFPTRDGKFEYPIELEFSEEELEYSPELGTVDETSQPIDKLWPSPPIGDTKTATTPLDKITTEQRRQVDAFAHILIGALMAAREPTSIVAVGRDNLLRNPDNPTDLVGVYRVASKRASARGIDKMRTIHVKGVCGKIVGMMFRFYGRWRWQSARNLAALVTGVRLTDHEMRALTDNLRPPR